MYKIIALTAVMLVSLSAPALAGKYNEVLKIGDSAPHWKALTNVVDDKPHSLDDLKDATAVVVVFTCNSCPTAVAYEAPLLELAKTYADRKVAVVAINVNRVKDDLPPAMKKKAEKLGFTFPYLYDESQEIAKQFGAIFTPEFFVLDKNRKVIYMGAMDEKEGGKLAESYVAKAIDAALTGKQPETTETVARGCRVRFVRDRK